MTTPNINGRGRGQNRFRGRGRGRNNNNQGRGFQNNNNTKKQEIKFFPHQTGRQQSVTFDTVKDHILQNIQKNYELGQEIATTLRNMTKIDYNGSAKKLTQSISKNTDSTAKKEEQESNEIIYKAKIDNWMKENIFTRKSWQRTML